jgi:hypothetical protein
MLLYRPVGVRELELIAASGFRAFPPRLPGQPIFYPVLTRDYAASIAREWNPSDPASGYAGFVTEFDVDDDFATAYPVRQVGASQHRELWVPAEELPEFNRHIVGTIRVTESHYGERFASDIDPATRLPSSVLQAREDAT